MWAVAGGLYLGTCLGAGGGAAKAACAAAAAANPAGVCWADCADGLGALPVAGAGWDCPSGPYC